MVVAGPAKIQGCFNYKFNQLDNDKNVNCRPYKLISDNSLSRETDLVLFIVM